MNKESILEFLKINKSKILMIFTLYCICTISIGIVNYPYYDDVNRRIYGVTWFWKDFCRLLSEIAAYIIQGSTHLTDMGLTAFFLSALILTVSSVLLLFILIYQNNKKVTWISAIGSVFVGINPWFLECLSYHFDSPFMCLSVLVSIIPFLFYRNKKLFFVISLIGCFLMCNSYQASSGIYLIMLLTMIYLDLLNGIKEKKITDKIVVAFLAYCSSMILYAFEMRLNPEIFQRGDYTVLESLYKMPVSIIRNLTDYFTSYLMLSSKIWIFYATLIIVIFMINIKYTSLLSKKKTFCLNLLYIVFGCIFSYGVYTFFKISLATRDHPRYTYGLSIFFGILLILLGQNIENKKLNFIKKISIIMAVYYSISFTFVYANVLDNQKDSFENYSVMLATDLNKYITLTNQTIYMNEVCPDSLVYKNSAINYPILNKLVPSNTNTYWLNDLWFNTITNMDVEIESSDFNSIDTSSLKLLESTKLWDIYIY